MSSVTKTLARLEGREARAAADGAAMGRVDLCWYEFSSRHDDICTYRSTMSSVTKTLA